MRTATLVSGILAAGLALGQVLTAVPPQGESVDLVVWDHFSGPKSAQQTAVGPNFEMVGSPVFRWRDGVAAMGVLDDNSLLLMPAEDFFGADRTQGTVSVAVMKKMPRSIAYRTPLPSIFGNQAYDFQTTWCRDGTRIQAPDGKCTNPAIQALWVDAENYPSGGLRFAIIDSTNAQHVVFDPGFNTDAVPVNRWVRIMFVWDVDGIGGGSDTMRIYRNDRVVGRYSQPIPGILDLPTPVAIAGSHAAERFDGPALLFDELTVLDSAIHPWGS